MMRLENEHQRVTADEWFEQARKVCESFWVYDALREMQKDLWYNWQNYLEVKDDRA